MVLHIVNETILGVYDYDVACNIVAVMSVSGGSMTKSMSGRGNGGGGGDTGSNIGDSGIADTASFNSEAGSDSKRIVFDVDRPAPLKGLNKSKTLSQCYGFYAQIIIASIG